MFQAATPNLRGCRSLCLPLRQPAAEERWTERCMRCRGSWPRRECHLGQTRPIETSLRCYSSNRFALPRTFLPPYDAARFRSPFRMLHFSERFPDSKGRTVIRGRIKNTSAVQHGLCCEPMDGPCGCLPFQRGTIECLANIGPLSDIDEPSGAKLKLLSPKTQHH